MTPAERSGERSDLRTATGRPRPRLGSHPRLSSAPRRAPHRAAGRRMAVLLPAITARAAVRPEISLITYPYIYGPPSLKSVRVPPLSERTAGAAGSHANGPSVLSDSETTALKLFLNLAAAVSRCLCCNAVGNGRTSAARGDERFRLFVFRKPLK